LEDVMPLTYLCTISLTVLELTLLPSFVLVPVYQYQFFFLEVGPLNTARGMGDRCDLTSLRCSITCIKV